MITKPRLGRLTQGSVFCGAFAEDYRGVPVWGIVITARCDTTHEKIPIVNYLPLVRIEDWLHRHGGLVVLDRGYPELESRFHSLLNQRRLSASLTEVHSIEDLAHLHFPQPANPTASKKAEKEARDAMQARTLAAQMRVVSTALDCPTLEPSLIAPGIQHCRKTMQAVISELLSHRLAGYYYLPTIGEETDERSMHGYVTLLREVHHIPRQTAKMLLDGIARDETHSGARIPGVCFEKFDFAYVVAELQSPWIEHLMQAFCTLFGRIGVADIDKARVKSILGAISPEEEGNR